MQRLYGFCLSEELLHNYCTVSYTGSPPPCRLDIIFDLEVV